MKDAATAVTRAADASPPLVVVVVAREETFPSSSSPSLIFLSFFLLRYRHRQFNSELDNNSTTTASPPIFHTNSTTKNVLGPTTVQKGKVLDLLLNISFLFFIRLPVCCRVEMCVFTRNQMEVLACRVRWSGVK